MKYRKPESVVYWYHVSPPPSAAEAAARARDGDCDDCRGAALLEAAAVPALTVVIGTPATMGAVAPDAPAGARVRGRGGDVSTRSRGGADPIPD
jgi:hypothetical protein